MTSTKSDYTIQPIQISNFISNFKQQRSSFILAIRITIHNIYIYIYITISFLVHLLLLLLLTYHLSSSLKTTFRLRFFFCELFLASGGATSTAAGGATPSAAAGGSLPPAMVCPAAL